MRLLQYGDRLRHTHENRDKIFFFGHSQKQKYRFVGFVMTHFLSLYNFYAALIVF